ncbi:MAG TPA: hypothetical protein VGK19_13615 [Capsulimonadaceae bacterium]|jgi:hypothetical protein
MPITTDAVLRELREVEKDCDSLKKRIDDLVVMVLSKRDHDLYDAQRSQKDDLVLSGEAKDAR